MLLLPYKFNHLLGIWN